MNHQRALTHSRAHRSQLSYFNMLLISIMKHPGLISLNSLLLQEKKTCDCKWFTRLFLVLERCDEPLEVQTCQSVRHFPHHWKVSAESCFCLDNSATPGSLHPSHFLFMSACMTLLDSCRKPDIRRKERRGKGWFIQIRVDRDHHVCTPPASVH